MYRSFIRLAGYVIGFGSLFAIWHIASVYLLNSVLFPPPGRVVVKAIELAQDGTLWENASVSLQRIALGFFFGSLVGAMLWMPMDGGLYVSRVSVRPDWRGASSSPTPSFCASFRRRR